MRWLRRRGRDEISNAMAEADRKLQQARARLATAKQVGEEVSEVAASLRELRRRNHFGPLIAESMRRP